MAAEYRPYHMGWFSCEYIKLGQVAISPNKISIYYINNWVRLWMQW